MGRDRHYVHGDFYRVDDRTGFPTRARQTRKEWTGLYVDRARWEPRHPQDFVKGVIDDQTVPDPRPLALDLGVMLNASSNAFYCVHDNEAAYFVAYTSPNPVSPSGINADSPYTNPKGTAAMMIFGGTLAPVDPSKFPSNIT